MAKLKFFSKSFENEYGKFDSLAEADRYLVLADMQERGLIQDLQPHVSFEIIPKLTKMVPKQLKTKIKMIEKTIALPARYTCDSIYSENGVVVIEEVKSKITLHEPDYVLRKKLMLHLIEKWNRECETQYEFRELVLDPPKAPRKKKRSKSDAKTASGQPLSTDTASTLLFHYVM